MCGLAIADWVLPKGNPFQESLRRCPHALLLGCPYGFLKESAINNQQSPTTYAQWLIAIQHSSMTNDKWQRTSGQSTFNVLKWTLHKSALGIIADWSWGLFIVDWWMSLVIGCWWLVNADMESSLVVGQKSLVMCQWYTIFLQAYFLHLVIVSGYWSLAIDHWLLVIGHWSLMIGYWSFVAGRR